MNKLTIKQNDTPETVSSATIHALYSITSSLDYTGDSDSLTGYLNVQKAYLADVEYLQNKFPGLTINIPAGNYYIVFEDPAVEDILKTAWGDGVGVTYNDTSMKTYIDSSTFRGNTNILNFDELGLMTTITSLWNRAFEGCTSLKTIDLVNINTAYENALARCSALTDVYNFSLTSVPKEMFVSCTSLQHIDLSNVEKIYSNAFGGCKNLIFDISTNNKITFLDSNALAYCTNVTGDVNLPNLTNLGWLALQYTGITTVSDLGNTKDASGTGSYGGGAFSNCANLKSAVFPDTIETIYGYPFLSCNNITWVKCLSKTPPTLDASKKGQYDSTPGWGCPIYVPDESLDLYKSAEYWSDFASSIKPLSQFDTDFPTT